MLQVLQSLNNGQTLIAEVPAPAVGSGKLLIRTDRTLISAGTEKMLVEFGQAGWIGKAKAQPEKVKQVLDKIRADGLLPTLDAVFSKLGEPLPLGYCNAGTVLEVGKGVSGFEVGDRVVSNGPHAGFVAVPQNLCAKIPTNVDLDEAAFTVLASIGLQGIRLAEPTLGECFVVYGLGLIGLITVQLLRANGCQVIGVDINRRRLDLAESFGAEVIHGGECSDIPSRIHSLTSNRGADGVIITASAKTDEIISIAAKSCRKRGRIVLVGVIGLNIRRSDFYEKELSFQVSCSYGPGRYDSEYEEKGNDYPLGFVRWTEQRNFEAVLQMLRQGLISFKPLISHRFPIEKGVDAYGLIQSDSSALGVVLEYSSESSKYEQTVSIHPREAKASSLEKEVVTAVVGAGNFTRATLMPAMRGLGYRCKYVVGRSSTSEIHHTASKFQVENATTDLDRVLNDEEVNLLLITTNHDSHARLVCEGLRGNKHVFVEKPLGLTVQELVEIRRVADEHPARRVLVGFNRRFSPHTVRCRELLAGRSHPVAIQILVNAGEIPSDHWVHDPEVGGGRIIGEACHFLDWISYVAGAPILSVGAMEMGGAVEIGQDKMSIHVTLADGSIGSVCYLANGSKAYPKESFRVFSDNRVFEIDNFRVSRGYGFRGFSKLKTARQEKGHRQQFAAILESLKGSDKCDLSFGSYFNSSLASIAAVIAATESRVVRMDELLASI